MWLDQPVVGHPRFCMSCLADDDDDARLNLNEKMENSEFEMFEAHFFSQSYLGLV